VEFGITATSEASRLSSALSAVMLSSRRSWAADGRNGSSPSTVHAVDFPASKPASRRAAGQSWRRSMGTVCTWAVGEAFNCASEVAWNARTSG